MHARKDEGVQQHQTVEVGAEMLAESCEDNRQGTQKTQLGCTGRNSVHNSSARDAIVSLLQFQQAAEEDALGGP